MVSRRSGPPCNSGGSPAEPVARAAATALPTQTVLYKSSALAATAPSLAFRRRNSVRIAAAAAAADKVRDDFKAEQCVKAGCAEEPGDSEETKSAKKYERRLLLNRNSASASRLRKEAYCACLEMELAELEELHQDVCVRHGLAGKASGTDEARVQAGATESNVNVEDCATSGFEDSTFDLELVPNLDPASFLG